MKRVALGLAAIACLIILPTITSSQVTGALPSFGASFAGGLFPGVGNGPTAFGNPVRFYVGWLESSPGSCWHFDPQNDVSLTIGEHHWRPAGVWIGVAKSLEIGERWGFNVDAWFLIPVNYRAKEADISVRSFLIFDPETEDDILVRVINPITRHWDTCTDWWYVSGELAWKYSSLFSVLGGFRYEHFSTRFRNPSDVLGLVLSSQDTADVTVNSYKPYIGFQHKYESSTTMLSVRAIGFPFVPADLEHLQTGEPGLGYRTESKRGRFTSSYFAELAAEYAIRVFGDSQVGAFVRWNLIEGRGLIPVEIPRIG
ncbi:MAG: hypothetical protein AB1664_16460, partial [Thermodesulfobacteriota bacterium]